MLDQLRRDLDSINDKIFELLEQRKSIVGKIQDEKSISWSPSREMEVFQSYISRHSKNTLKEDLVYSLIIENQAGENYPKWSSLAHLDATIVDLKAENMVNPILLKLRDESKYQKLSIQKPYKEQIEQLWKSLK